MSPGNLYRYFPSKNAIVAGLVERDRDESRRRFAAIDHTRSFWEQFVALGRAYFVDDARSKAVLCLEIWAEATRNPEIDAINSVFEAEALSSLEALLDSARARGEIAGDIDSRAAAHMIMTITSGLYVRTGLGRAGDGEAAFEWALQSVCGLLTGAPALRLGDSARAQVSSPDSLPEPSA